MAPLLVILPLVAGSGPQDLPSLGLLVAKATFGFGGVLALGSVLLRRLFEVRRRACLHPKRATAR